MAIVSSGTLAIGTIRSELCNTGTSNFSLKCAGRPTSTGCNPAYVPVNESSTAKPNNTSPWAVSEWYSYNHSEYKSCSGSTFTTPDIGYFYTYYKVRITGSSGYISDIVIDPNQAPGACENYIVKIFTSYPFTNTGQLTGTPVLTYTFGDDNSQTQTYTMTSSADDIHIVCYIESFPC